MFGDDSLKHAVFVLVHIVDAVGAIVIFVGVIVGFVRFARIVASRHEATGFTAVRLDVGRYLALGLEFQLAADLLRTAVAPSFAEIGKLAAIAAIRTSLNYFLRREIRDERLEIERAASRS